MSTLDEEFKKLSFDKPIRSLPISHVSNINYFDSIIEKIKIFPSDCKYFNQPILYTFYGLPYYRTGKGLSQSDFGLPIAFMFSPDMVKHSKYFYPFDTGAALSNKFDGFKHDAISIDRYKINNDGLKTITHLVNLLFGSNKNYRDGQYQDFTKAGAIFNELHTLYHTDLTHQGLDHRKYSIECQSEDDISLIESLIWVSFPESYMNKFMALLEKIDPAVPDYFAYPSHLVRDPQILCGFIELKAREFSNKYYEF